MKAILEFNLDEPEDEKAHLRCVKALDMACLLWYMERERCKLINGKQNEADTMRNIRMLLAETDLNIDELT